MARKKTDWIVYIEEVRQHEIKVSATTNNAAEREAKKIMKNGRHKAKTTEWEVVNVEEEYEEEMEEEKYREEE